MADGDVNERYIGRAGNYISVAGTCEADEGTPVYISGQLAQNITDANGDALSGSSNDRAGNRIISCMLNNADETDETFRLVLNSNNGTADSLNGCIYITGEGGGVDTYHYYCLMQM